MKNFILICVLLICAAALMAQMPAPVQVSSARLLSAKEDSLDNYYLLVDKQGFKLLLYNDTKLLKEYPIATGKNPGDKQKVGDCRTPLGNFMIEKIEDATCWQYDFGDGNGYVKAYGKWFIRLQTNQQQTLSGYSWSGIGIHGTHDESSIGTLASRGCLRMHNKDLIELVDFLHHLPDFHIPVIIRETIDKSKNYLS